MIDANLPTADLPVTFENFLVAIANGEVVGAVGLQIFDHCGLLRSLVVKPNKRGLGIAEKLLTSITEKAVLNNLSALYLLTETAPGYFVKRGFTQIDRDIVPATIKQSSQFSHVCPVSAIIMKKSIL